MAEQPLRPADPSAPETERLRHPSRRVLDQRQQQIDPAGEHRRDRNARPEPNTKQPGGLPQKGDAED